MAMEIPKVAGPDELERCCDVWASVLAIGAGVFSHPTRLPPHLRGGGDLGGLRGRISRHGHPHGSIPDAILPIPYEIGSGAWTGFGTQTMRCGVERMSMKGTGGMAASPKFRRPGNTDALWPKSRDRPAKPGQISWRDL
jgi:hypothetical protein